MARREARKAAGTCDYCGKLVYWSRVDARRAARTVHHGDSGLAAYECHNALAAGFGGLWHIGHLRSKRQAS